MSKIYTAHRHETPQIRKIRLIPPGIF